MVRLPRDMVASLLTMLVVLSMLNTFANAASFAVMSKLLEHVTAISDKQ